MRQQPRPESGGNETQEADFNVDLALRDGKFLAFLDKTPDIDSLDPNESGYAERIRAHFEIFKGAEELKREIVKTLKDKIKSESGVSLSDADFEAVQAEIEREAISDPEVLKEKLEVVRAFRELPKEVSRVEGELRKLGGVEALGEKQEELTERKKNLELASEVDFLSRSGLSYGLRKANLDLLDMDESQRKGKLSDMIAKRLSREFFAGPSLGKRISGFLKKSKEQTEEKSIFEGGNKEKIKQELPKWSSYLVNGQKDELVDSLSECVAVGQDAEAVADIFFSIADEEGGKLKEEIEHNENLSEQESRQKAYDSLLKEQSKKGFGGRLTSSFSMPKVIASELEKVNGELVALDRTIQTAEALETHKDRIKQAHGEAREQIMGAYEGTRKIAERVRAIIEKKYSDSISGASKTDISVEQRAKELEQARKLLEGIRGGDEGEYIDDLEAKRAEIQEATEKIIESDVERSFAGLRIDGDGAYNKTLKVMTDFLKRARVGDKTGEEARDVLVQAMKRQSGALTGARRVLIRHVLSQLKV
jgi:hypothetical protein